MSATRWAETLLAGLVEGGVRSAIVSPGSRSTPLTHAAAITRGLRVRSIIDERSAGFFALGEARVTGAPSLLIATSGSAAGHYLPAVLEARHAGLPLIVLTADRPFELQHAGASQTTDQLHLFGRHARGFFELGSPEAGEAALSGLRSLAARAVRLALEEGGAVHLNARFRKPFDPEPASSPPPAPPTLRLRAERTLDPASVAAVAERLSASERPLLVAGPLSPHERAPAAAVAELARRLGAPLLAEATSQLRFAELGPGVARAERFDLYLDLPGVFEDAAPDLVIELGRTPTARAYAQLLAQRPGLPRLVLSPASEADPFGGSSSVARVDLGALLPALLERLPREARRRDWSERILEWEGRVDAALRALRSERTGWGELEAVELLYELLPAEASLMVGNSLPVRHVDRWLRADGRELTVLSQRGLAGIEGMVSGAAGSAAASGRPLALLVGDVSFLHDLGGLAAARMVQTPLVILVLHNDGGRIFEELPIAQNPLASPHKELWTTPHGLAFGGVAASFGLPHRAVTGPAELRAALEDAFARPGASVVEARVPPEDAERTWRGLRARLGGSLTA